MNITKINNHTRILGIDQGYLPLPIQDVELTIKGEKIPAMISEWTPTEEEIEKLKAGEKLYLVVLGQIHPPVKLTVGKEDATPNG